MADEEGGFNSRVKRQRRDRDELREYVKTPIWICDNHDHVLYYIHRAIASRHLPFEGNTLLHFDSHPDLTIPLNTRAETVFEQGKLYEEISIADWILPAVYAGHVSRVIWIKPPWSDQIEEGRFKFKVGRHKETGFVRVTCSEIYFVEELLYSDEELLENCKDLELIVCILKPGLTDTKGIFHEDKLNTLMKENESTKINFTETLRKANENRVSGQASDELELNPSIPCPVEAEDLDCHTSSLSHKRISEETCNTDSRTVQFEADSTACLEERKTNVTADQRECSGATWDCPSITETDQEEGKPDVINKTLDPCSLLSEVLNIISKEKHFLLDIDMDFFSTQNPFKQLYTEEEMESLRDIYKFEKPKSRSKKDLSHCVKVQKAKVEAIEATYVYLQEQPCGSNQEKNPSKMSAECSVNQDLVHLSEKMRMRKGDKLDYEMLHFAGLCVDLPHHVSSYDVIDSLMVSLTTILRHLPRPTVITMARSVHDEYTPPGQVDDIQSSLLQVLSACYGEELSTNRRYETTN